MSDPYKSIAHLAKSFGDSNRIVILEYLSQRAFSVENLSEKTGLPLANLSHHLQILKQSGLVVSQRRGRQIVYSLRGPLVVMALQGLRGLHRELYAQESLVIDSPSLVQGPKIRRSEAIKLIQRGQAVLLDVRPADEYKAGHIRGAVHIPLQELETRLNDLPKDMLIVSYCRGPYCQLSAKASEILESKGWMSKPLEDGYPEWWAEGNPVEGG